MPFHLNAVYLPCDVDADTERNLKKRRLWSMSFLGLRDMGFGKEDGCELKENEGLVQRTWGGEDVFGVRSAGPHVDDLAYHGHPYKTQ